MKCWTGLPRPLRNNDIIKKIFKREFRVYPQTFEFIINVVGQIMTRQNTNFRDAILLEKRVAIALWRLATGNAYRVISKVFGVSSASVNLILLEFCSTMRAIAAIFIFFPTTVQETRVAIDLFQVFTHCEIPQVVGCLDCMQTPMFCPDIESKADYYSRKQEYSINTQAVVGANLRFLDVATGWPGSMHDSRVLRASNLYERAQNEEILTLPTVNILNSEIRPIILADGAYPPVRWIIKPYPHNHHLTPQERNFNKKVSSSRSTVERAFGMLKVRWRCLLKPLEQMIENIPDIIITCCVLHNICQDHGEEILEENLPLLNNIIANIQQGRIVNVQNICNDFDQLRYILTQFVNQN